MSPPARPRRILMTADAVGGVWCYSADLAPALAQNGHHVHLVTLGPRPRDDQIGALVAVPGITIETTDLALEWMDSEGHDLARARERLTAIEREFEPDVVHLNGYREATAPWRTPVLVVAHSCVRSWWHACRGGEPNEPRWERYAANVEDGLNAAGEWVAPTAAFRAAVQTLYAPSRPGRVIWNGIASPRPAHGKEPFILTAGRLWDEAKNVSVLASVAANVPWPIRLAGETRTSENRGAVAPQGANDLHLLGTLRRGEVLDQMNRAAIYVAPALYEPFGLAILEAAAAGCALVLSDIATMRELWDGAALFVQARDAGALERALDRLCGDAALRMVLQRAALRRARRYSIAKTAAAYAQLYRTLEGDRALGSAPAAHRRPSAMELAQ